MNILEAAKGGLSVTTLDGSLFDISYKGQKTQVSEREFLETLRRAERRGVKGRTLALMSDAFYAAKRAYQEGKQ